MTADSLLAVPAAYRALGVLVGAARTRAIFVREYVRPQPGQRLLDVGCGTGELVPFLANVDYVGFDASAAYVRAARARHPSVRFVCEDVGAYAADAGRFDVVVASAVLHHLADGEALGLLRLAEASLRPGGRLVTLDGCWVAGQHPVSRWLLSRDRGRHVRTRDEYEGLLRQVFPDVVTVVRHDLLRVPYTHLIAECART